MIFFGVSTWLNAADIEVVYLKIAQEEKPILSNLDPIPEDLGNKGAELAVVDNNTTGKFMGYDFALNTLEFERDMIHEAIWAVGMLDTPYILLDMNADEIQSVVDAIPEKIYFNISSYNDALRSESCKAQLFHTIPSYAMRADSLSQYLVRKRWDDLVLLEGATKDDIAFAEAVRHSAKKFGLKIKQEAQWLFDDDMRRSASNEVPLFTQQFGDYDVMLIADEANDFARYLAYNTWEARPIMGADGLMAKAWSDVMEQWGATQLQSRFVELANRDMQDVDYAAWTAIRAIDEAYIRTEFGDQNSVYAYLVGDEFELAGFKGRPLSFRSWNGQMRQPIGLVTHSAPVAFAPLEGFLHHNDELDSIGFDAPESQCKEFGG